MDMFEITNLDTKETKKTLFKCEQYYHTRAWVTKKNKFNEIYKLKEFQQTQL